MTTATLNPSPLTTTQPNNVGAALHEIGTAVHRLATALWAAGTQRSTAEPRVLTVFEEAAQLRAFADEQYKTDPRFAQDLYCAADRHELAGQ
jgi:hypothetical protein